MVAVIHNMNDNFRNAANATFTETSPNPLTEFKQYPEVDCKDNTYTSTLVNPLYYRVSP
jgi:hypothetical protein